MLSTSADYLADNSRPDNGRLRWPVVVLAIVRQNRGAEFPVCEHR